MPLQLRLCIHKNQSVIALFNEIQVDRERAENGFHLFQDVLVVVQITCEKHRERTKTKTEEDGTVDMIFCMFFPKTRSLSSSRAKKTSRI